jgi:hypothetical protein
VHCVSTKHAMLNDRIRLVTWWQAYDHIAVRADRASMLARDMFMNTGVRFFWCRCAGLTFLQNVVSSSDTDIRHYCIKHSRCRAESTVCVVRCLTLCHGSALSSSSTRCLHCRPHKRYRSSASPSFIESTCSRTEGRDQIDEDTAGYTLG